jgi:hypothetical protein
LSNPYYDPDYAAALPLRHGGGDRVAISDLAAASAPAGTDLVLLSQSGAARQLALSSIFAVGQSLAIANATNGTDVITQLNALLAFLRTRGDIASS